MSKHPPDYYEEIVMQAITELVQQALQTQRASGGQVAILTAEQTELEQQITANQHPEARELLDRYLSLTHTIAGLQEEHLYIQGAKDCARLLRELGALT